MSTGSCKSVVDTPSGPQVVDIEVDVGRGIPGITIVGSAEKSLQESWRRVRAAWNNSGLNWPRTRITVSLLPATGNKGGTLIDAALACALYRASHPHSADLGDLLVLGELSLSGELRHTDAVTAAVLHAQTQGSYLIAVPRLTVPVVSSIPGSRVLGATDLTALLALAAKGPAPAATVQRGPVRLEARAPGIAGGPSTAGVETATLIDPSLARALEVAVAGQHHLHLTAGDPEIGGQLAAALRLLLPPLTPVEAAEAAVRTWDATGVVTAPERWFAAPVVTAASSSGTTDFMGGAVQARARQLGGGLVRRARSGALILDDLTSFRPEALARVADYMRPLPDAESESGHGRPLLILREGPCACNSANPARCLCTPSQRARRRRRLPQHLLALTDLHLRQLRPPPRTLPPVTAAQLHTGRGRILAARQRALTRWRETGIEVNRQYTPTMLVAAVGRTGQVEHRVRRELDRGGISVRRATQLLRVAWSIADLAEADAIDDAHLDEAILLFGAETARLGTKAS